MFEKRIEWMLRCASHCAVRIELRSIISVVPHDLL